MLNNYYIKIIFYRFITINFVYKYFGFDTGIVPPNTFILHTTYLDNIFLDDDAKLKVRWDSNYYLTYNEKRISLGNKVIAYNTITDVLKMYGTFYEIASDGKIIEEGTFDELMEKKNLFAYQVGV